MSTQYPTEREEVQWALNAHRDRAERAEAIVAEKDAEIADLRVALVPAPTGEPAPCVWRATSVLANPTYRAECVGGEVSVWLKRSDLSTWSVCPYCKAPMQIGHPLTVER